MVKIHCLKAPRIDKRSQIRTNELLEIKKRLKNQPLFLSIVN